MAEAAVTKRVKINKYQGQMMLAVLGASLVLGVAAVFSIFFFKYIRFNVTVINEKDAAISNYYAAIKNVGICIPKDKDGKFSDADLKACDPHAIDVADIPDTLRYNIMINTSDNNSLESVARDVQENCYNGDGKKIDYTKLYRQAKTNESREMYLNMLKMCSSLRVIPDALPAAKNDEALLSSMNQILLLSNVRPDSLAPSSSVEESPVAGIEVIPVSVKYNDTAMKTITLLENFEKSIRSFSFQSATITWTSNNEDDPDVDISDVSRNNLELSASALAFYTNPVTASETTKTVYASKEAKKSGGASGIKTVDDVVDNNDGGAE